VSFDVRNVEEGSRQVLTTEPLMIVFERMHSQMIMAVGRRRVPSGPLST